MTPEELKSARHALGLSAEGFASWVNVQGGRTVRKWEAGDRDIPGPVAVLVRAAMESEAVRHYFGLKNLTKIRIPEINTSPNEKGAQP